MRVNMRLKMKVAPRINAKSIVGLTRGRLPFCAVVGCAALVLVPAYGGTGSTVTLRFKYKAGETISYQTNGQIAIPMPDMSGGKGPAPKKKGQAANSMNLRVNSTEKIRVIKLDSNGNAHMEITSTTSGAAVPGQPAGTPTVSTTSVTVTPLGVLSSAKPPSQGGAGAALSSLSGVGALGSITVYLPSKPVSPGDTWKQKVEVPQMTAMGTVSAVFEKLSQVGRYKTAHIKLTVTVPITSKINGAGGTQGATNISGSVTMHYEDDFAIAEGKLIKSSGTGSTDISIRQTGTGNSGAPGAPKPMSMHMAASITMTSTLVQ